MPNDLPDFAIQNSINFSSMPPNSQSMLAAPKKKKIYICIGIGIGIGIGI